MNDKSLRLSEARAAYSQNDLGRAAALYRSVLSEEQAGHGEAFEMLGIIAQRMGKYSLALELIDAALALSPDHPSALTNRAVILRQLEKKDEAWHAALRAMERAPSYANAWHTASFLALEKREFVKALEYAKESVRLDPTSCQYSTNLANALMVNRHLQEAHERAVYAVRLGPNEPSAHLTLGQILKACGYPDLASQSFDKTLSLQPGSVDAKMGKAASVSIMGDWLEAWPLWEQRFHTSHRKEIYPTWTGARVGSLLVYAEQGMGDTLQFSRWIPVVSKQVDRLVLQVQSSLKGLLARAFPDVLVIGVEDPLPAVEAQISLLSLPYVFPCSVQTVPDSLVITPLQKMKEQWRAYLASRPALSIGLVREGNPGHANDHNRSIPKTAFDLLKDKADVRFLSLQNGFVSDFFSEDKEDLVYSVLGQEGADQRIEAIAALMTELDLVISVDTMPLHLAGCLGVPTWGLLPFDPDWRWLYEKENTGWYRSVRLFRQEKAGDWDSVLLKTKRDLAALSAGQRHVLLPQSQSLTQPLTQHPQALKINLP